MLRRLAMAVVVLGIAGCAGSASVTSVRREGWDRLLDRTLIRFEHDRLGADFMAAARKRLAAELKARGVESQYAVVAGALAMDAPPSLLEQAKAFQATTVLALDPAGGTVTPYGEVKYAKIEGKLWDVASEKLVWRAVIGYTPGDGFVPFDLRAEVLVREVVTGLVKDGLVRGPPPAPPRAR